jgi:hypothetical protein
MPIPIYLELGTKRIFASATDWPGWARSGKDEASALHALFDYSPRYEAVLRPARLRFQPPDAISAFKVIERLKGDTTTDFGAPGCIAAHEANPINAAELKRLQGILKACWHALGLAVGSAKGKTLRLGPRGGGRDLDKMVSHVLEAEKAYLSQLGWKSSSGSISPRSAGNYGQRVQAASEAQAEALAAAAHGELPSRGPRGGLRWPPRYFARRSAWHILDHAWEIEDRLG